jgi:hypothetical protein
MMQEKIKGVLHRILHNKNFRMKISEDNFFDGTAEWRIIICGGQTKAERCLQ